MKQYKIPWTKALKCGILLRHMHVVQFRDICTIHPYIYIYIVVWDSRTHKPKDVLYMGVHINHLFGDCAIYSETTVDPTRSEDRKAPPEVTKPPEVPPESLGQANVFYNPRLLHLPLNHSLVLCRTELNPSVRWTLRVGGRRTAQGFRFFQDLEAWGSREVRPNTDGQFVLRDGVARTGVMVQLVPFRGKKRTYVVLMMAV